MFVAIWLVAFAPVHIVNMPPTSKGIYVVVAPQRYADVKQYPDIGTVTVRVTSRKDSVQYLLSGKEVSPEVLRKALNIELCRTSAKVVFVDGDTEANVGEVFFVVDTVNNLKAKAVLLTPKLKQELARSSSLKP